MILIKQLGVFLNQSNYLLKQCIYKQFLNKGMDITPEQYLVMDLLWDEGTLSQQEIADFLEKDKNSVTQYINGLEKKELLVRINDTQDRRKKFIVLTPAGRRLKNKVTRVALRTADSIIKDIPQEELEAFVATLVKMTNNMKLFLNKA